MLPMRVEMRVVAVKPVTRVMVLVLMLLLPRKAGLRTRACIVKPRITNLYECLVGIGRSGENTVSRFLGYS